MAARKRGGLGRADLSYAKDYVYPTSRRRNLLLGLAAILLALPLLFWAHRQWAARFASGPLSAGHATFEGDCSTCHLAEARWGEVSTPACTRCHERPGIAPGAFGFLAHYVYGSEDHARAVVRGSESGCVACHVEHQGRATDLTMVGDAKCNACHEFGRFEDDHPEFEFLRNDVAENSHLEFQHFQHVRELARRQSLGVDELEATCASCHQPERDGAHFKPISFDAHCSACHLNGATATHWLPVADGDGIGVASWETLAASLLPVDVARAAVNPTAFQTRGGKVMRKTRLRHADPWILENLRRLRQRLFDGVGLADLIGTSADVDPAAARSIFDEALATLRRQAQGLRQSPAREIQRDLDEIERQLAGLERRLDQPHTVLDLGAFSVGPEALRTELSSDRVAAYEALADTLAASCLSCHQMQHATILRVRTEQRALTRAAFNHAAHVLETNCFDCHNRLSYQGVLSGGEAPAADHSATQNLPGIDACRTCHQAGKVPASCTTCHLFHPDKTYH